MCKRGTRAADALRAQRDKRLRRRTGEGQTEGRKGMDRSEEEGVGGGDKGASGYRTRECALTEKMGFGGHVARDIAMQRDATCMCDPDVAQCRSRRWPSPWS